MRKIAQHSPLSRLRKGAGKGQAVTELALLAPLIAIMLLGIIEVSGAYGAKMDVQAATSHAARIGAIEGNGGLNVTTCPNTSGGVITDTVDLDIVRAVLSVRGLSQNNISKIEVFKASPGGGVSGGLINTYTPPFTHTVSGVTSLYVASPSNYKWPSCQRNPNDSTAPADSLGVHVSYTYYPLTPLFGRATITIDDDSIQRLNPTQGANPCPIPGIPAGIAVTTQDTGSGSGASYNDVLSWGDVPGATSYAIYQEINGVNGNQFQQTPIYSGTLPVSGGIVQYTIPLTNSYPSVAFPAPSQYQLTAVNFCGQGERNDAVGDERPDLAATATAQAQASQTAAAATATASAVAATATTAAGQTATAATATAAAATATAAAVPTTTPTAAVPTTTPGAGGATATATPGGAGPTATSTTQPGATATPTATTASTATPTRTATVTTTAVPTATATAVAATVTATATPITVDDSTQGTGVNQFSYSGSGWLHCSGSSSPTCAGYGIPSGLTNGTLSFDNHSPDAVTLTFTAASGQTLKLYGSTSGSGGSGTVSIDGGAGTTVSFSGASVAHQLIWTSPTLAYGSHTFKLQVNGTGYISVDSVIIS